MKSLVFLLSAAILTVTASATIRTVSNNPATIAQFNTIQAAIDASASGDTIEVAGSPYNYPTIAINNKQLTLIGPGFLPDKDFGFRASVSGGYITGNASSGSVITGIRFTDNFFVYPPAVQNLSFIRNIFDATPHAPNTPTMQFGGDMGLLQNYLFEGNVFYGYGLFNQNTGTNSFSNFLFRNNYFFMSLTWYNNGLFQRFYNCSNVVFDHNLWMGPTTSAAGAYPATGMIAFNENCRFLTFSNNIFMHFNMTANNTGSIFYNNIIYNSFDNTPWANNGNTDGGGNISNQDPQMAAQTAVNAGTYNPLADYSIAAGPADNAATDGKDMGLLFEPTGPVNWNNARNSRFPRISKMKVVNSTVAAGASISVSLEAKTSN